MHDLLLSRKAGVESAGGGDEGEEGGADGEARAAEALLGASAVALEGVRRRAASLAARASAGLAAVATDLDVRRNVLLQARMGAMKEEGAMWSKTVQQSHLTAPRRRRWPSCGWPSPRTRSRPASTRCWGAHSACAARAGLVSCSFLSSRALHTLHAAPPAVSTNFVAQPSFTWTEFGVYGAFRTTAIVGTSAYVVAGQTKCRTTIALVFLFFPAS